MRCCGLHLKQTVDMRNVELLESASITVAMSGDVKRRHHRYHRCTSVYMRGAIFSNGERFRCMQTCGRLCSVDVFGLSGRNHSTEAALEVE